MRHLKLYEEFGIKSTISKYWKGYNLKWYCKRYGINNYTINDDGSIDVDGDVYINGDRGADKELFKIPIKFRNVSGSFTICNSYLSSLEGCPINVGDSFNCSNNRLASLKGGPNIVGDNFDCSDNMLVSLEGGPTNVGRNFICSGNSLTSLKGSPINVGYSFHCYNNMLTSFDGSPNSIGGDFNFSNNNISSLEDFPSIGGYIIADNNPVYRLINLFYTGMRSNRYIELFNDYDIVRGNSIVLDRLNSFLKDIGKDMVDEVKGYDIIY